MKKRHRRSSVRPRIPFWKEGPRGPGLRYAVPIRDFIRTGEERRSAEGAAERLRLRLAETEEMLEMGVPPQVVDRIRTLYEERLELVNRQLQEHARLKAGLFENSFAMQELGPALIRLRIAAGLTQRQLAQRLRVAESTVCRDEQRRYRNARLDKVLRVLDVLGAELNVSVTVP